MRPLLTSEPTGNVIPMHAGYSSGLGSARPGLSQKGGLPILARAFVGSRPPTRERAHPWSRRSIDAGAPPRHGYRLDPAAPKRHLYGRPYVRTDMPKSVRILRLKSRVTRWEQSSAYTPSRYARARGTFASLKEKATT